MANFDDGHVLEGYICPNCMKTFNAPDLLLKHFENEHSGETDILKSLQDLFGKAKKKILNIDDCSPENVSIGSGSLSNKKYSVEYYELYWPAQDLGASRSHTHYFKKIRDDRSERFSHEINNLIIRLDKMLTDMPTESVKKKIHEQNIVPWLDGKDVTRCPNCTKSFNIAKRQHHCRLCGCIMCHDCSLFLPLTKAKQILVDMDSDSATSTSAADLKLRVCSYCTQLLESREQLRQTRNSRPSICDLYDAFIDKKKEADEHCDMYMEMIKSLLAGERKYYSADARSLRVKIAKVADNIDTITKKIVSASNVNSKKSSKDVNYDDPTTRDDKLRKSIRSAAAGYIYNKLLTLPNVPSDSRLAELQEKRLLEEEAKKREEAIQALKERQDSVVEIYHDNSNIGKLSRDNSVSMLENWSPASLKMVNSNDPLVQQISNIKQYINEARLAHKYNELASLELNLKELQEEYFRRQHPEEVSTES